jgi:hypothetical protein
LLWVYFDLWFVVDLLEFSLMLVDFPVEWRSVGYGYLLNSSPVSVIVVLIMGIFAVVPVPASGCVFCVCVFGRVIPYAHVWGIPG